MRLLGTDSPEVVGCLASEDCVVIRRPWADLRHNRIVLAFLTLYLAASWTSGSKTGLIFAAAALTVLILVLAWRAAFSLQNWTAMGNSERFYVRLFRQWGYPENGNESNVIAFEPAELSSMTLETVDVYISGPRPRVLEALVIEVKPQTRTALAKEFTQISTVGKRWFTRWNGRNITIPPGRYHPTLRGFLEKVVSRYPSIKVTTEEKSELELTGLARKPVVEQRTLLVEAKRLGLGWDCITLLMDNPYRRMSMREALRFISDAEAHADMESKDAGSR